MIRGNKYICIRSSSSGMSEEKGKEIAGLVFVACMFIGAGIGLLFGRPDVGGAIGMGIGFLLMGVLRVKRVRPSEATISLPRSFGQVALCLIGALMIVLGLLGLFILYRPELIYPYLVGVGVIIIGVLIILAGLIGIRLKA